MPITEKENDEIQEKLEKQIEDQTPEESQETDETKKEKSDTDDDSKQEKPWWEQRGFTSEEKAIESYDSAQSLIGTQGTELGELRKAKNQTSKEEKTDEPYDKYDPYDEENAKYFQTKWAREAVEEQKTDDQKTATAEATEEKRLEMIGKFIKNHPKKNKGDLEKVAQFAHDNGIYDLEHANTVMNANESHSEETDDSTKENRGKQINEIPATLSDTGGGGKKEKKYADATQSEWDDTPKEERVQALRDA